MSSLVYCSCFFFLLFMAETVPSKTILQCLVREQLDLPRNSTRTCVLENATNIFTPYSLSRPVEQVFYFSQLFVSSSLFSSYFFLLLTSFVENVVFFLFLLTKVIVSILITKITRSVNIDNKTDSLEMTVCNVSPIQMHFQMLKNII